MGRGRGGRDLGGGASGTMGALAELGRVDSGVLGRIVGLAESWGGGG